MSDLAWKLKRLRVMGAAEIAHRVGDAVRTRLQARGIGLAKPPAADLRRFGKPWLTLLPCPADSAPYLAAADALLAGRRDVFALRAAPLGFPPRWNRDPKTGIEAPLQFGKALNYRDEQVVGDIKYLWEPNRHLALGTLAQAYHLSGEARYADGAQVLLESWFEQNPYPLGANWSSALELGIRLVNWSVAWHLLGGINSPLFQSGSGQQFLRRWLDSIYRHCHFIAGYFSRHSSANNHLFGELAGLHIAALTWPCWPESKHWLERSAAELEVEALKQTFADGVNREQAIYYQHSVADMMLLCGLLGRANGCPRSDAFWGRLEKMLEFIAAMLNAGGGLSTTGDADDALLVQWSQQADVNIYRSLLASGAVLFQRGDFKYQAGRFDDKSCWLLGEAGRQAYQQLPAVRPDLPRAFAEGGMYFLGRDFDTPQEIQWVADAGPLGYLGIAAHGHADALALTLAVGGVPVLIDPGTYAYHTHKKWRDYFRGTSAHNTLRVDGLDQSEPGGNFLWLRKASAVCEAWHSDGQLDSLQARHDGYQRLADPVLHRRKAEFCKKTATMIIDDSIECRAAHLLEWHWHVNPLCRVSLLQNGVRIDGPGFHVELAMQGAAAPGVVTAAENPPLGWVSWRFDDKQPAPVVVWKEQISGPVSRRTVLRIVLDQTNSN